VLATAAGCGYRLVGAGDAPDLTVSIVTLANDSVEPGVELTITRALRREFLRRAAPRLISNPGAADLVIRGRVLPLSTRANSFDTVALALEYRVEVSLVLEVQTAGRAPVRIDPDTLRESELYLASADAEAARKNREEALRRIADVLAGRIHEVVGLQLADRPADEPSGASGPSESPEDAAAGGAS
jgi:hypothetical protein